MLAEQRLQEGRLDEALDLLQQAVRQEPGNARYRTFLFQLLAVLGQWDRALKQLQVAGQLDPACLLMVQTYREALLCERLRAEIFAGRRAPLIFGDPQPWLAKLLEALRLTALGEYAHARELREQAFEAAPAIPGTLDGQPFQWLADADPRLGPVLEGIINGRYYWIPLARLRSLTIDPPADLRDMVWLPARFIWTNGGEVMGLIPARYPGSESDPDPLIRLARRTDWRPIAEDLYLGLGQRMLATDQDEYPLLDCRLMELSPQEQGNG